MYRAISHPTENPAAGATSSNKTEKIVKYVNPGSTITLAPGFSAGPELERANPSASFFLTNHKCGIFSHRTPEFNSTPAFKDPSRCQPVIGQIELRNFEPCETRQNVPEL